MIEYFEIVRIIARQIVLNGVGGHINGAHCHRCGQLNEINAEINVYLANFIDKAVFQQIPTLEHRSDAHNIEIIVDNQLGIDFGQES